MAFGDGVLTLLLGALVWAVCTHRVRQLSQWVGKAVRTTFRAVHRANVGFVQWLCAAVYVVMLASIVGIEIVVSAGLCALFLVSIRNADAVRFLLGAFTST